MAAMEMIKTYIDYHLAMTRRVWESIDQISDGQFLADDAYSRGSIRNLMVHLASTDRRWLTGLRNQADVGHVKFEDYPTYVAAREFFESVAKNLSEYVNNLSESELFENSAGSPGPRWQILLHMINHGTDHRATVLQKLAEFGAPTFEQDLVFWLWKK